MGQGINTGHLHSLGQKRGEKRKTQSARDLYITRLGIPRIKTHIYCRRIRTISQPALRLYTLIHSAFNLYIQGNGKQTKAVVDELSCAHDAKAATPADQPARTAAAAGPRRGGCGGPGTGPGAAGCAAAPRPTAGAPRRAPPPPCNPPAAPPRSRQGSSPDERRCLSRVRAAGGIAALRCWWAQFLLSPQLLPHRMAGSISAS